MFKGIKKVFKGMKKKFKGVEIVISYIYIWKII